MTKTPGHRDGMEDYHTLSETVGLVPTLRARDNVVQAIAAGAGLVVGALLGWLFLPGAMGATPLWAAGIGAFLGLVVFVLGSGLVLMVAGWARAISRVASKRDTTREQP